MGELDEKLWAVISERGCEASSLAYKEAAQLARRLRGEKVSGLCVITEAAARRLKQPEAGNGKPPEKRKPARRRRPTS